MSATAPTSENRNETPRRAKTRELILSAAFDCLREEGLAGTSAAKIAARCDLSWGVIQYHFGDRAGLLLALLDRVFEQFQTGLTAISDDPPDARVRLETLVDEMWAAMGHVDHQVMLDIQLELGRDPRHQEVVRARAADIRAGVRGVWRARFPDLPVDQVDRAERMATLGLQGLAVERATVGRRPAHRADVAALVDAIGTNLGISREKRAAQ